jgi:putative Mn2+ efflux pump MntP
MTIISIFLVAVGLSMDAVAVAMSCGLMARPLRPAYALRIAFFFGAFQALMPVLGWGAGVELQMLIGSFDHWIAFFMLMAVGCKMIYESFRGKKRPETSGEISFNALLVLAMATSIDACAVGICLAFLKAEIILPSMIIGLITFVFSFAAVWTGARFGRFLGSKLETAGGLILIGIAVKILSGHLNL